ncbi:hypothetical protein AGABI2DRAFT_144703 [Agaricus bisporus var. bisporus H97]|uniref:hypothetical protein n=1 Tax=Agaricus bisporus var. bisporus (strain H97 / ATCC MYA-4626 / FGSC 10389) TaxID=936046 RepID=UPI00029F701A|nr:hypothetical protein AGABI2DRAFT_144703 [Agaricus bisporus var. bisporus H97]EKV45234.1 hypothetical protein AGABI2DRAFT_144703 [Agaricus bisporus var. bisporus H97]
MFWIGDDRGNHVQRTVVVLLLRSQAHQFSDTLSLEFTTEAECVMTKPSVMLYERSDEYQRDSEKGSIKGLAEGHRGRQTTAGIYSIFEQHPMATTGDSEEAKLRWKAGLGRNGNEYLAYRIIRIHLVLWKDRVSQIKKTRELAAVKEEIPKVKAAKPRTNMFAMFEILSLPLTYTGPGSNSSSKRTRLFEAMRDRKVILPVAIRWQESVTDEPYVRHWVAKGRKRGGRRIKSFA